MLQIIQKQHLLCKCKYLRRDLHKGALLPIVTPNVTSALSRPHRVFPAVALLGQ